MTHIKTVKVTNPHNVLVQIPKTIIEEWGLDKGDGLEVATNGEQITIMPRKGFVNVRPGISVNAEG